MGFFRYSGNEGCRGELALEAMKMLAFSFKVANWSELERMTFTGLFLCAKQASEWANEQRGVAEKAARRRRRR